MIKLWFAPRTRSVRILWLLEELGLPYELEPVEFQRTESTFFTQATPTGKLPTVEDGDVLLCESGAIVEYILERYGEGRLAPPIGSPERGEFLQWLHFAEATAFPPIGIVVWLTLYRDDADKHPDVIASARERAAAGLDFAEKALEGRDYLLASAFSAADIMMGFTLFAAMATGILNDRHPRLREYLARLGERPAFQTAFGA